MRASTVRNVISSRDHEAIRRVGLDRPLSEGIIIRVKTRTDSGGRYGPVSSTPFSSIETCKTSCLTACIRCDDPVFSVVVGRLATAEKGARPRNAVPEIRFFEGTETIQRMIRIIYRQLRMEADWKKGRTEKQRARDILSNIKALVMGNGTNSFGMPLPAYAISFSESVSRLSRISGVFIFRQEGGAHYDYVPLGRGLTKEMEDTDGVSFFNFRTTAFLKVQSDRHVGVSASTDAFLKAIGLRSTIVNISMIDRAEPEWREQCSIAVEDEIENLAISNSIQLQPSKETLTDIRRPPRIPSEEETRVDVPTPPPEKSRIDSIRPKKL